VAAFAASFSAPVERVKHVIDWAGAATLTLALSALVLVTSLGGSSFAWGSREALGLLSVLGIALAAFVVIEVRAEEPILPLSLFRSNVFTVSSVLGLVSGASILGAITFLPLYLQIARGYSPTLSGLLMVPMTLGIIITSAGSGRYMGKTGRYKILPPIGMALLAAGALLLTFLSADTGPRAFGASIFVLGLGLGCIFPVVTTAVQNAVPRAQLGTATAAGVMFRQIGGSLAVAVFGAMFTARLALGMAASGTVLEPGMELGPQTLALLPEAARTAVSGAVVDALHPIFWVLFGLSVLGFVVALALKELPLANRVGPKGA